MSTVHTRRRAFTLPGLVPEHASRVFGIVKRERRRRNRAARIARRANR